MKRKLRYYNSGNSLGIIGTYISHEDGEYSFIPTISKWILTECLFKTREEAAFGKIAKFL